MLAVRRVDRLISLHFSASLAVSAVAVINHLKTSFHSSNDLRNTYMVLSWHPNIWVHRQVSHITVRTARKVR